MKANYGTPFQQTATHASSAVATQTGVASTTCFITDISASSDKAGSIVLVKDGTTVIWQDIVGVGNYSRSFKTPLFGSVGASVSVTIDGTSVCKSNMTGFTI